MYSSKTQANLNLNSSSNIKNRYLALKGTSNVTPSSTGHKPFSRKPLNQIQHVYTHQSNISQGESQSSLLQRSIFDIQSVASGGNSVKQSKFVRTNKLGFLSPKSKSRNLQQSFSPEPPYGTQSMVTKVQNKRQKSIFNDSVIQKQQIRSQNSGQQNSNYLHKSISSTNLYKRNNKTRNMILSKFSQVSRKSRNKDQSKLLQTSLQQQLGHKQNQEKNRFERDEKIRIQKMYVQVKHSNVLLQNKYSQLSKVNQQLKSEIQQLKKYIKDLNSKNKNSAIDHKLNQKASVIDNNATNQNMPSQTPNLTYQKSVKLFARTDSSKNINQIKNQDKTTQQKVQTKGQTQKQCKGCIQKQKSNQKQVSYFQDIIRKHRQQITILKNSQIILTKKNQQLEQSTSKMKSKLVQLLEHEKICGQNQVKFQQCVQELKNQVIRLQDELRYLKIQNSVLLKIKNQNLKLKIDITKIQDQRDYFKMKVVQINKKNNIQPSNNAKKSSQSSINRKTNQSQHLKRKSQAYQSSQSYNKLWNINTSKKFYLDSTQTEQVDYYNETKKLSERKNQNKSGIKGQNRLSTMKGYGKPQNMKQKWNYDQKSHFNSQLLFDLTSEQSQNSY